MRIDADIYFEESTRIRLREPLHFECGGDTHEVPTGFISDGMSIPRFFWRLLSPPVDGERFALQLCMTICTQPESSAAPKPTAFTGRC